MQTASLTGHPLLVSLVRNPIDPNPKKTLFDRTGVLPPHNPDQNVVKRLANGSLTRNDFDNLLKAQVSQFPDDEKPCLLRVINSASPYAGTEGYQGVVTRELMIYNSTNRVEQAKQERYATVQSVHEFWQFLERMDHKRDGTCNAPESWCIQMPNDPPNIDFGNGAVFAGSNGLIKISSLAKAINEIIKAKYETICPNILAEITQEIPSFSIETQDEETRSKVRELITDEAILAVLPEIQKAVKRVNQS